VVEGGNVLHCVKREGKLSWRGNDRGNMSGGICSGGMSGCLCDSVNSALDVCVQLCGCSLVVLGLYVHADRQSSVYVDLLQSVPVSGPLVITGHLAKVLVVMVTWPR